jgi:hypothetical protein
MTMNHGGGDTLALLREANIPVSFLLHETFPLEVLEGAYHAGVRHLQAFGNTLDPSYPILLAQMVDRSQVVLHFGADLGLGFHGVTPKLGMANFIHKAKLCQAYLTEGMHFLALMSHRIHFEIQLVANNGRAAQTSDHVVKDGGWIPDEHGAKGSEEILFLGQFPAGLLGQIYPAQEVLTDQGRMSLPLPSVEPSEPPPPPSPSVDFR